MPTYDELKGLLNTDEPDYSIVESLVGSAEIPHLDQMIRSEPADLAAKATSLAGMLSGPPAITLLETALQSSEEVVRIAAAAYLGTRPPHAVIPHLTAALDDASDQVRFVVLDRWNTSRMPPDDLLNRIVQIWDGDSAMYVRDAADGLLKSLRRVDHFCGNRRSLEVHRIRTLTSRCQLDEIKRFKPFGSLQGSHGEGYDNCAYCIGNSTR